MKKSVVNIAILTSLVSSAAFAAQVYDSEGTSLSIGGRAEGRFNVSDNNEVGSNSKFDDRSRARVNITGNTKISDSLSGFGKYEAEFDTSSNGDVNNRYAYAGLSTDFGRFSYGKQDSAQVMLTNFTDTMATFGADAADLTDGNKDKREANFLYAGKFSDFTVQANYLAPQTADDSDQSFGVAGIYTIDSFDLGAGFVTTDDDHQINFAANIKFADFVFGAFFAFGEAADEDASALELSAMYKLDKLLFVAVYNTSDYDALSKKEDEDGGEKDNIAMEAVYLFNSNLRAYAGYKFEFLDNLDNQLQAGIRYDF